MIYANGKIYVIFSNSKKIYYIGSTTQTLTQRLANHNCCFKCFKNGTQNYVTSYEVLACEDYQIKLIEDCPCANNKQLNRREGELIKTYKIDGFQCVNKCIVGRTSQEYYTDHKEQIKQYYADHKESILEQRKEYRADHKDVIAKQQKQYDAARKEQKKQYRADHKEQQKQYRADHKEQINAAARARRAKAKAALTVEVVKKDDNDASARLDVIKN